MSALFLIKALDFVLSDFDGVGILFVVKELKFFHTGLNICQTQAGDNLVSDLVRCGLVGHDYECKSSLWNLPERLLAKTGLSRQSQPIIKGQEPDRFHLLHFKR